MRIGLVAPPFVEVPPERYGGTEAVVDTLARGLQEAGHEVRLFSLRCSRCPVPTSFWYERPAEPMGAASAEAAHVVAAYAELDGVDVVHDHSLLGPLVFAGRAPMPVVTTCHNPFTADLRLVYRQVAAHAALVAVSYAQRRSAPELPVLRVIHHGLDLRGVPIGSGSGGYLAFLGRMGPDKGAARAARVARAAGLPLRIAAKMRAPDEVGYFETEVLPLLGDGVEFLGEVDAAQRAALLAGAVALVNPIRWPEPFGLAMIEALATGTPVVALAYGSAPEVVRHGETGFLCHDEDELVVALRHIGTLDRAACRADVEARFTMQRMVADYVRVYEQVRLGVPARHRARAVT
ncbi:glycosyltransferase family 4 protein [Isoptericola sp. b441]|uniref:Glycosyltransferase family 4 protein n=1 Tax=Actinotalea lenta TaxID=3064654 RepID=A0ABT9DAF9_9CELL|nr:glycosyltransferase family 4 protein [Isoptericola sp. b441]MDO8107851.1 glycosyltransferase family 4 protein [Isoptericola sp. b441]